MKAMLQTIVRWLPPSFILVILGTMLRPVLFSLLVFTVLVRADVPLPPSMLNPTTAAEAWNVIRLASDNVDRLIKEQRPLEVPAQIALLSPALRTLAKSPVKAGSEVMLDEQTAFAFKQVNLIAKEAMAENNAALVSLQKGLRASLEKLATGFEPVVVSGEIYHCIDHTDFISLQPEPDCPQCQKRVQARRIPYSFIHARSDKPTVTLTLDYSAPRLTLKLRYQDGSPVLPDDLWLMHTALVQVLAIGPAYQHVTALPTETPGNYACDFTPQSAGLWRIHAGLTPAQTGLPEYPSAELVIAGEAETEPSNREEIRSVTVDGFHFLLSVAGSRGSGLQAGQLQALHLQVQDAAGQPFAQLEPVQQAFAHIDAFYTESPTLMQLHPTGGDILREELRGGPGLSFRIYSPEPGWLKLFCRVKIGGKVLTTRHQLQVQP